MEYMTAGELRGASLVAIVDDVPAGLRLQAALIQADLDRWSHGCSCGERREEVDCAAILSGRFGGWPHNGFAFVARCRQCGISSVS